MQQLSRIDSVTRWNVCGRRQKYGRYLFSRQLLRPHGLLSLGILRGNAGMLASVTRLLWTQAILHCGFGLIAPTNQSRREGYRTNAGDLSPEGEWRSP